MTKEQTERQQYELTGSVIVETSTQEIAPFTSHISAASVYRELLDGRVTREQLSWIKK